MLKHCILAYDYSDSWQKTCDRLPSIIKLTGIQQLTIVHVVDTSRRMYIETSAAAATEHLKDVAARLNQDLGITVGFEVRKGFAASELHEAARFHRTDGIILLNQSHSAGHAFFYGNITLNLARITQRPLLILPADSVAVEPDGPILLATDGSGPAQIAQTAFERLMTKDRDGLVLWVETDEMDDESHIQDLAADLTDRYPKVIFRQSKGSAVREIVKAAEDEQVSLVVIGKRGATPIQDLLIGSTAEGVARESRQPVLLVPVSANV